MTALESMSNVLSAVLRIDDDHLDDFEEVEEDEEDQNDMQSPPSPGDFNFEPEVDLEKIDGVEEKMELGMNADDSKDAQAPLRDVPRKPKLASLDNENSFGGRNKSINHNDRVSQFATRKPQRVGSGTMLGGGQSGSVGAISS